MEYYINNNVINNYLFSTNLDIFSTDYQIVGGVYHCVICFFIFNRIHNYDPIIGFKGNL